MTIKNIWFIVLLTVGMGIITCCGDSSQKKEEKSYTEKLVGALDKTDALDVNTKIKTIKAAMDTYFIDHNEYPEMLEMLVPDYLRTKHALVDPWGTPFEIETDEEMNLILVSAGKDKTFDTTDDIKRRI